MSEGRSYVQLWLQGHWSLCWGCHTALEWPLSPAAAQAAVAAAPFPALHVETEPPAVAAVASALLGV